MLAVYLFSIVKAFGTATSTVQAQCCDSQNVISAQLWRDSSQITGEEGRYEFIFPCLPIFLQPLLSLLGKEALKSIVVVLVKSCVNQGVEKRIGVAKPQEYAFPDGG